MKMDQSVPKRRHVKFRRREITQKKTYSIQNTAKVWNKKYILTYLLTYILTYLLTYSVKQSPSWEVNRFSASQEIPPTFYGTRSFITAFTSARHISVHYHSVTWLVTFFFHFFMYIPCILIIIKVFWPTDAQLDSLKKFEIHIKIDIKRPLHVSV